MMRVIVPMLSFWHAALAFIACAAFALLLVAAYHHGRRG